jgi:transcriptional regulator with XRE-family HTH domain
MTKYTINQTLRRKIGRNVLHMRLERGWSQKVLADRIGYDTGYISLLENGKRGISVEGLVRIARTFSVKPGEMLDRELYR